MHDTGRPANRLIQETSPYLRQHAYNPVDWHPWGPEALERARRENKPIFLSIGYSACHWCHVMEHESFEDAETARLLNEHFVSIKVDREERPDLDQIYMNAVLAMTGHGGWPMSVFLTPDLKPFFAGTYFPPQDRYGMPGFPRVVQSLAATWEQRHGEVVESAERIADHLRAAAEIEGDGEGLSPDLLTNAVNSLRRAFDPAHGGFGGAPKFPHPLELKLLLRAWRRFQDTEALDMGRLTLDRMAMGGMYDQLGGGFHRYSTDARWLVPHFEKMLYDNALLAVGYLEAYQATGDSFYREVVEETLAWIERDMTSPAGAFFSTLDADSEGEEGKYYVWSSKEIEEALGAELAELFSYVYDVSPSGSWEGHNILNRGKTITQCSKLLGLPLEELRAKLAEGKQRLLERRSQRVPPGRDEKILTAWNGLTISAFALAGQVLDARFAQVAQRAAEFVWQHLRGPGGQLFRTCVVGQPAKLNGYLEDYSFTIDAFITLYEATFEPRWLEQALELANIMTGQFWDERAGGFFFVARDHEPLIVRGKDPQDGATPSGNSVAATALLRLAHLTGRSEFEEKARRTLEVFRGLMAQSPTAFGQMLVAYDYLLGPVDEIAVIGPRSLPETVEALRLIRTTFLPNKVVAFRDMESEHDKRVEASVPLLAAKTGTRGRVTTYLCRNFTCERPLVGVEALRDRLKTSAD
jgi:hypothetical protein